MITQSIGQFMQVNNIGVLGTDIFIGDIPEGIKDAINIVATPSPQPNRSIGEFQQSIDFWGRFSNSEAGYLKMKEIYTLFHRDPDNQNYEIDDFFVYNSFAQGQIMDMDRDSERSRLYKLSIIFRLKASA